MNNKWKWFLGITRAMIVFLLPSLLLALFFPANEYGMMSLGTLSILWLIMIAWVVVVVFGLSEEG